MKISIALHAPVISPDMLNKLQSLGDISIFDVYQLSEEKIIKMMPETEILICGATGIKKIWKKVFDALQDLKFIAIYGVGYDWVDISETTKRGIIVSNNRGNNAEAVAEHTWGMILSLSKRISELERATRDTGEINVMKYQGVEVFGKTIGIIWLGEIGKRVARIAKGFNMKIIGTNKSGKKIEDIEIVDLLYLLEHSDIITVCVPLNKDTENLINKQELKLVKKNVILVNASREKLVNKNAVLQSLSEKNLFGYGVETDACVPIDPSDEYFQHPNIVLTPHNARNTKESEENALLGIIKNTEAFLNKNPINVINP